VRSGIWVALEQPKMFVDVILCETRRGYLRQPMLIGCLLGDVTVVAADFLIASKPSTTTRVTATMYSISASVLTGVERRAARPNLSAVFRTGAGSDSLLLGMRAGDIRRKGRVPSAPLRALCARICVGKFLERKQIRNFPGEFQIR
jgi:hypothetical protein